MSPIPNSLTFNEQELTVVDHEGKPWLTTAELEKALAYKSKGSLYRLYSRNREEFTKAMCRTVKLTVQGNLKRKVRIFSARGCHLIGMLSDTEKAPAFRKWVLDVLEKQTSDNPNADDQLITLHKSVLNQTGAAIVQLDKDGNSSAKPINPSVKLYITTIVEGQAPNMMPLTRENLHRLVTNEMPEYMLIDTKQFAKDIKPIVQANNQAVGIWAKLNTDVNNKLLRLEGGKS